MSRWIDMETHTNGYRFINYEVWSNKKNQPYDYEKNGILKHIMSHSIVESKNQFLQYLLQYIEKSLIICMKFVERMQHFKDPAYTNR